MDLGKVYRKIWISKIVKTINKLGVLFFKRIFLGWDIVGATSYKLAVAGDEVVIESKESDKEALHQISLEIDEEIKDLTEDDGLELDDKKEKLLKRINDTAMKSYESALNSGLQTVKTALSKSTFDGDKDKHPDIIDSLHDKAEEIWKGGIINKID